MSCSIDGCGRRAHAQTLCTTHYSRLLRRGDALTVLPRDGRPLKGDVPTFGAVHRRLSRSRGPAREYSCVDCGGAAAEWSYDGLDGAELTTAQGSAYSLDLARYAPRCVSCHRSFDRAGDRERDGFGRFTSPIPNKKSKEQQ